MFPFTFPILFVYIVKRFIKFLNLKTQEMNKNSTLVRKIIAILTGTNFFSFHSIRSVFRQPEFIQPATVCYKEVQKMLLEDYRTW